MADTIQNHPMQRKIVMYASAGCGYCWRAKHLLTTKGYAFEIVDVTFDRAMRAWLAKETGLASLRDLCFQRRC